MAFRSFTVPAGVNRSFIATNRIAPDQIPGPKNLEDPDALKRYVFNSYTAAYSAMMWQFSRMRTLERFYSGLHYLLPQDNFDNEITNYAFSLVETVWPELVSDRPRPLIKPRWGSGVDVNRIKKHKRLAQWCMDVTGFDEARRLGTRAKLKFGWNVWLMLSNPRTGLPYPRHWSNWHFVPDPAATHMNNLMYFFLASPVSTNVVKAVFGDKANGIKSDNYVSPGFRSLVQNHSDYWLARDEGDNSIPWSGSPVGPGDEPIPSGTAWFVPGSSESLRGANTTYLLQMVFRDLTKMKVVYEGSFMHHDPEGGEPVSYPGFWSDDEHACESGWRVATFACDGTFLQSEPLDSAWGGLNIVMGHDYQHEDRLFGYGEIDMVIPKIRAINRNYGLLNRSLEFESTPVVVADRDSSAKFNRGTINPGEVLLKKHGSSIEWLQYRGVAEHQFQLMQSRKSDLQDVSGVTPAQEGQRPAGIEAGTALRTLLTQSLKRTNAKIPQCLAENAEIVKKQMSWLAQKTDRALLFMGSNGQDVNIEPSEFYDEFDLTFDESTATQGYREQQLDRLLALLQAGVIDAEYVIDELELPNGEQLKLRIARQQMIQMLMDAKAKGQPGGKGAAA